MQFLSLIYPWGGWSPAESPQPAPTGWPTTITSPSAVLGIPCSILEPMTMDQAAEFYWRPRTADIHIEFNVPSAAITTNTTATAKRYTDLPPFAGGTGVEIADGDEGELICDDENGIGPSASVATPGVYAAQYTVGAVTWVCWFRTRFIWFDRSLNRAIISFEFFCDFTYSSGLEYSFISTEQPDDDARSFAWTTATGAIYTPDIGTAFDFEVSISNLVPYSYDI